MRHADLPVSASLNIIPMFDSRKHFALLAKFRTIHENVKMHSYRLIRKTIKYDGKVSFHAKLITFLFRDNNFFAL